MAALRLPDFLTAAVPACNALRACRVLLLVIAAAVVALPASAADWGLTVFLMSERAGGGSPEAAYSPGDRARTRLAVENRGEAALADVRIEIELLGAAPVLSAMQEAAAWTADGNRMRTTIGTLAPGQSLEFPIIVELADGTERGARGAGGEARIRVAVPASGETVVTEARWPVANCAEAYYEALRLIRLSRFADLRAAVEASRKAEVELPGRFVFGQSPAGASAAVKFADQIARARGLDAFFATEDAKWVSGRIIRDMDAYLGQDLYPGLCTGVAQWTAAMETHVDRFARRAAQTRALLAEFAPAAADSLAAAGGELGGEGSGTGGHDAAALAAELLSSVGGEADTLAGVGVFAAARDWIGSGRHELSESRRRELDAAFAMLERQWYLELALDRAEGVAGGFAGTLEAIRAAHRARCTCAN